MAEERPTESELRGIGDRSKDVSWYLQNLTDDNITAPFRQLLEEYSHIPQERVKEHILQVVRDSPHHKPPPLPDFSSL